MFAQETRLKSSLMWTNGGVVAKWAPRFAIGLNAIAAKPAAPSCKQCVQRLQCRRRSRTQT